jgi:hypothetical protein
MRSVLKLTVVAAIGVTTTELYARDAHVARYDADVQSLRRSEWLHVIRCSSTRRQHADQVWKLCLQRLLFARHGVGVVDHEQQIELVRGFRRGRSGHGPAAGAHVSVVADGSISRGRVLTVVADGGIGVGASGRAGACGACFPRLRLSPYPVSRSCGNRP